MTVLLHAFLLSVLLWSAVGITFGGTVTTLTPLAQQRNMNVSSLALADLTFNRPRGIAVNTANTIFISDTSYIVSIAQTTATVVAGQRGSFGFADGSATTVALLNSPAGVATVGATLFFADSANHAIRALVNGGVATIAGKIPPTAEAGLRDGTGGAARFNSPQCIVGDSANNVLYVCDVGNLRIRRVTTGGEVSTLSTILPGNIQPSVRLVLLSTTLYVARQVENSPQSAVTTLPTAGGAQTAFATTPQSPAAAVLDTTSKYFVTTQDNRIGVINVNTAQYTDITGVPTTVVAADGQYPQTTPVFIQLVDIARAATGNTFYTLEAGPSPRLRVVTMQDITPTEIAFVVSSNPPITNTTALTTLAGLVQQELAAFWQRFGYTGTSTPNGTVQAGNRFVASMPTEISTATAQQVAQFETTGNPVRDFVTAFNADRAITVPFTTSLPPRSLQSSQQTALNTAFKSDIARIVADPRVTSPTSTLSANTLTLSAQVPGSFINATTQANLVPASFPAMTQQLAIVNAVKTFDARIFDFLTPAQLMTASQHFATDVGNTANTDNVQRSDVQVGNVATLTAGAPAFVLQPFLQTIADRGLQGFPTLFNYLNSIFTTQAVDIPISYYPTNPTEQANIQGNITARARALAGSDTVTATVVNATGTRATVVYRYSAPVSGVNFSNVNLSGVFSSVPPAVVVAPIVMSSSCPPVCIAVVVVVGTVLLLLLLLLLLWCCCKSDRKDDVVAPQFQPVFQPNATDAGEGRRTSVINTAANPLYRTSELRESRREDRSPPPTAETVASTEIRMRYHEMRDAEAAPPTLETAEVTVPPPPPPLPTGGGERLDDVIRVLHVSPRREGSKSTRLPNPLVYDSVMRRLETQDAAQGSDSVIRVVKVVTRDSPSRSNRSASASSRSKRHVRVEMSPNPYIPELADTAAPHTLTAVESALRQL